MIKVLYLVSNLESSGTTTHLYNLIKGLNRKKYDLYILTLSEENTNSKIKDFENISTIINANISRFKFWFSQEKIFEIIESINPDIVHSHTFRPDYINGQLEKKGYKTLSTLHSHSGEYFKNTYGLIGNVLFEVHKNSMKKITNLISCSYSVQKYTKNIINKDSIVVYNGTTIEKEINIIKELAEKRIVQKKKKIIFVGSMSELKNVKFLINSFIKMNKNNEFQLVLVGDGPLLEYAKEKFEYGIITHGNVDNVGDLLQDATYFVSASTSEGLPMAVIEAMSYGLPVLLSDIPSHKEIVNMSANIGLIFKNNNYYDFLKKIEILLRMDYKHLSFNAYNVVKDFFDKDEMSKEYGRIYEDLY